MTRAGRSLLGAIGLAAGLAWPSIATADPLAIVDSFFADARALGATTASHGPITYDPGTEAVVIPNAVIEMPVTLAFGKAGSFFFTFVIRSPEVAVAGLREVDGGFRADRMDYADGTQISVSASVGETVRFEGTLDGTSSEDLFWPYLPAVQVDPDRPLSSYFPYLRWAVKGETGRYVIAKATMRQTGPQSQSQETVYENFEVRGIRNGRIEEYRIGRTVSESTLPAPQTPSTDGAVTPVQKVRFEMGPILYRDYDVGTFIRLIDPENYLLGNTDPNLYPILSEASVSSVRISAPDVDFTLARYGVFGVQMRQPEQSIFALADRLARGEEPSEQEAIAFGLSIVKILAVDRVSIDDIRVKAPQETDAHIERVTLRGLSSNGIEEFSVDRIAVASPEEGEVKLGRFLFSGLVFPKAETIVALAQHQGPGDPPVRLILDSVPMLNEAEVRDFVAHLKEGSVSLDRYSTEMGNHIPPFPTVWRERIDGLAIPKIAFQDEPDLIEFLNALGLNELRTDAEMSLRWDESSQDLIISPISVDIDGVAALTFEARIAGVPRLVFENPEAAQAALGTLAFTSARIELKNEKLVQTALQKFADDQGMTPGQAKDVLISQLRQMLTQLNSPEFSDQVIDAVSRFLDDPRSLTVTARPDQPLPATQILGMAAVAPQEIIKVLGISIDAR